MDDKASVIAARILPGAVFKCNGNIINIIEVQDRYTVYSMDGITHLLSTMSIAEFLARNDTVLLKDGSKYG